MSQLIVKAKQRPKWYHFRWKLSNYCIYLARKIKPDNPELKAFLIETFVDQAIYGRSIVRVDPKEMDDVKPQNS